jgi:ankyrin repeat protein
LQSLSFQEMNRRQHEIDDAAEGTCCWLLQDPAFVDWKREKNGLLWLTGKPGSGKSTLLKYALRKETKGDIVLSFFFYERGTELQRTPRGVYQTFLHQLLLQNRERVRPHVFDIVDEFQEAHKSLSALDQNWVYQVNEFQGLLIKCLRRILATHTVEILIDALDECAVEDILVLERFFRKLQAETPDLGGSLRLCISCRHYPLVKWTGGVEICVDARNLADIRIYVQRALEELEDEADRRRIEEEIVDRSDGVFLWVRLVLPAILSQHRAGFSVEQMRSHLRARPTDLYRVFQDIIHQLVEEGRPENDSPQTLELFQWLCFASRPLSLTELRHAMNVSKKASCAQKHLGSIKDNKQMEKRLRSLSGGLAEAKTYSDTPFAQLIHQTVKDYLITEGFQILDRRLWCANIVIGRAHIHLTTACIKYMSMDEVVEQEDHVSNLEFPFLDYAISSWILHAEQAEAMNVAQCEILTCFDWPSPRKVDSWVRIWTQRSIEWPVPKTTLLHASARHGLFSAASAQIWRKTFISDMLVFLGFKSGTILERFRELARIALQAYYSHGHVDVDCRDEDGRTPLSFASEKGHLVIVKLLLSQDNVDIDSADTVGRTPLSWATTNGDEAVTRELVRRGADVNKQVQMGMTPLHLAAQKGNGTLVHLLVEAGARSDVQDERGRTALHEAALHGHVNVVQRLIEAGADINARDKNGDSVLHRVCGSRDPTLARLLVKRQADVLAVAEVLIKHGAKVDVEDNNGGTPLHRAAKNGRKALVLLMLENGANATAADHEGRTALDVAAKNDDGDIAWLLQSKTTITAQDNALAVRGAAQDRDLGVLQQGLEGNTESVTRSLEVTAIEGQQADELLLMEQQLIDSSIDAQAQALKAASARGNVAIVEFLLKKHPTLVDHDAVEAALRKAAGDGQVAIVRLMLECGVNPRARHEYEPSALHLAAFHGQEETAQLLLEEGIGVHSEEYYTGNPLHYAAWAGQPALVELLLRHGAKANDRVTMSRDTALHVVAHTPPAGKIAILQLLHKKQLELNQEETVIVDRYKAVIRVLLKNGANPRLRNGNGRTASELAETNDVSPFSSVEL